jgi:hypothetical protein
MIVTVDDAGATGVVRDAYAPELPPNAWSDARNVRFREGYAEKMRGHTSPFGTPSVGPYHVFPFSTSTARYFVYAGLQKLYYVDTTATHTEITRASGNYNATADGRWNGGVFSGIAVLNNGVDVPQYWAGTGVAAPIPAWPAGYTARVVRPWRSFLIALNITKSGTNYPHMVKLSHSADPGALPDSWDHTDPTKDAVERDLTEDSSPIVDGRPLGDTFVVYKENAYYAISEGGPRIITSQKISGAAGALTTNCVAEFPGGHFVMGQGDIFVHALGAPQSILTQRMRRWLYGQLDDATFGRCFVSANPLQNEIWACIVPYGQAFATLALVWNWRDNTFTVRELPGVAHADFGVVDSIFSQSWDADNESWDSDTTAWDQLPDITKSSPRLMMASPSASRLYLADQSRLFDSSAITAYAQREGVSFGDPRRVKMLKRIVPVFEAPAGTQIRIRTGAAMDQASGTTWTDYSTFTVGTDFEHHCFSQGRYLAWEFSSNTTTAEWRLKRFDLHVDQRGAY